MRIPHRLTSFTGPYGETITVRSILEARWAFFFSGIGVNWIYEPKHFENYTPDFGIISLGWVEVKPTIDLLIRESAPKMKSIADGNPERKLFAFVGSNVTFETVALYHERKIFTPSYRQMIDTFCRLSDCEPDYVCKRMNQANKAKFDHFVSIGAYLQLENPIKKQLHPNSD